MLYLARLNNNLAMWTSSRVWRISKQREYDDANIECSLHHSISLNTRAIYRLQFRRLGSLSPPAEEWIPRTHNDLHKEMEDEKEAPHSRVMNMREREKKTSRRKNPEIEALLSAAGFHSADYRHHFAALPKNTAFSSFPFPYPGKISIVRRI